MSNKDCIKAKGLVTDSLGGDRYRVELDNGVRVLATLSGKMHMKHIRVLTGDRVEIEMSPYDLTRGRISYRYNPQGNNNV
jgi:translation initiation factor IF-1